MAFDANFLQPIGGQAAAGGSAYGAGIADATTHRAPQMFSYMTADAHATVDTADYFLAARHLLEIGDLIFVAVINSSGALQTAGFHVVKDKTATSIDVTDVTAGTVTDSD